MKTKKRETRDYVRTDIPVCPHCHEQADEEFWTEVSTSDGDRTEYNCESCGADYIIACEVFFKWSTATSWGRASDEYWGPKWKMEPA